MLSPSGARGPLSAHAGTAACTCPSLSSVTVPSGRGWGSRAADITQHWASTVGGLSPHTPRPPGSQMSPEGLLCAVAILCVLDSTWGLKPILSQSWGGGTTARVGLGATVLSPGQTQPLRPALGDSGPHVSEPQDRGGWLTGNLVFSPAKSQGGGGHTVEATLPSQVCLRQHPSGHTRG